MSQSIAEATLSALNHFFLPVLVVISTVCINSKVENLRRVRREANAPFNNSGFVNQLIIALPNSIILKLSHCAIFAPRWKISATSAL